MGQRLNLLLLLTALLPPMLWVLYLHAACTPTPQEPHASGATAEAEAEAALAPAWVATCALLALWPMRFVHVCYFIFVDVGFYLIYVAQGSTWLIDPMWQLLPLAMALFYALHPSSTLHRALWHDGNSREVGGGEGGEGGYGRCVLALLLLTCWAARLLHNYFRREGWAVGSREDWRYADMRKRHGEKLFFFTQFFAVSLAQHGMLVGLTLPFHATATARAALGWTDAVGAAVCVAGICIGCVSDNQLYVYMKLKRKPVILNTGLWKYSRHPNHCGEQLWWLGVLMLSMSATLADFAEGRAEGGAGAGVWAALPLFLCRPSLWWPYACGVLFNHPLDTLVTLPMIEERMLLKESRRTAYQQYQKKTSLLCICPSKAKCKRK